ncbi:MAG: RNA polymerase sigma factor [Saprospiraceae bacterium]
MNKENEGNPDGSDIIKLLRNKATKERGFALLVSVYQEQLYWHVRKMVVSHDDAKDVLQETFLRSWRNIDQLQDPFKLLSWLYRIASNETFRFLEKKKRQNNGFVDFEEVLLNQLKSEPWIDQEEVLLKFQRSILTLPVKQRMAFNLRYFEEMTYEQIADIMQTSAASVKVSYHYAKRKVEAILKIAD